MHDSLTIVQPEGLGRAVHDALARILDRARGLGRDGGDLSTSAHLALLAAGRFETARLRIRSGAQSRALPLIAARYAAWSGDLRTVAAAWAAVRQSAEALGAAGDDDPSGHGLRRMTWSELQRTASDVGDPAFAATIHRLASRAATVQDGAGQDGARQDGAGQGGSGSGGSRAAAADTGGAPTMLVSLPDEDDLDEPARLVLHTVHGVLGAEPDAMRHRLRLRPVLTAADPVLDVRGIRFGDGSASLRGARASIGTGAVRLDWSVAQESGAIPLTVLLEPRISGTLVAARVDDGDASLAPQPFGAGTIVPVQLVLDEERRLRLDVQDTSHADPAG